MRRTIMIGLVFTLSSLGMIDSKAIINSTPTILNDSLELMKQEAQLQQEEDARIKQYHKDELNMFLSAVGHRESGNRYGITNKWGYMGKYQFGKSTLKGLGFKVTKKEFLSNPELQEKAMISLLLHNKEKLQKYIDVFDGKTINGMLITESGILAAAHLGGQGSVKRYFKHGKVFKDGYGTKITSYMEKFSGYDIQLN